MLSKVFHSSHHATVFMCLSYQHGNKGVLCRQKYWLLRTVLNCLSSLDNKLTIYQGSIKLNPADLPSKGVSANETVYDLVWWHGPYLIAEQIFSQLTLPDVDVTMWRPLGTNSNFYHLYVLISLLNKLHIQCNTTMKYIHK